MMTLMAFLVAIGVLVTVHELGHYFAARSCGVKVLRFSVGFGRTLYRYQKNATTTEWVVAMLPLGGYVKMLDSREPSDAKQVAPGQAAMPAGTRDWSQAFDHQPVLAKLWIVFAGPLANLVLAFVLYWGLLVQGEVGLKPLIGAVAPNSFAQQADLRQGDQIVSINQVPMTTWQETQWALLTHWTDHASVTLVTRTQQGELHRHALDFTTLPSLPSQDPLTALGLSMWMPALPAVLGEVLSGSVADKSGLRAGDQIVAIHHQPVSDWQQVVKAVRRSPNQLIHITYMRAGQSFSVKLIPDTVYEGSLKVGRLGAAAKPAPALLKPYLVEREYGWLEAANRALIKLGDTMVFTLKMLGKLITGEASLKAISGPVSIADAAGESAGLGLKPYIGFIALLSISIAVMNLLPIPVLDGGHLLYHIVEFIRKKPLSDKALAISQRLGMSILGALMFIAFFNDINRYLIG